MALLLTLQHYCHGNIAAGNGTRVHSHLHTFTQSHAQTLTRTNADTLKLAEAAAKNQERMDGVREGGCEEAKKGEGGREEVRRGEGRGEMGER